MTKIDDDNILTSEGHKHDLLDPKRVTRHSWYR